MKTLLATLMVVTSTCAYACKPAPLPECSKSDLRINMAAFDKVVGLTRNYQDILDKNIVMPKGATSCFNNHFATFYLGVVSPKLTNSKGLTCEGQMNFLNSRIKFLIDESTQENLSVKNPKKKAELKALAKAIETGWTKLTK